MTAADPRRLARFPGSLSLTALSVLCLLLSACARIDHLAYEPYVADIDGVNQLEISTYPADFGDTQSHVPFLYRRLVTHDKVYFQVFIRARDRAGKNPHVESIRIHSFSYRFGNQPPTVLMTDYDDNFWMQGQPNYNKNYADSQPVLFVPDAEVTVTISFTLNGDYYEFEGDMPADVETSLMPLIIYALE